MRLNFGLLWIDFVIRQEMEDARWADTLVALESVKADKLIDEERLNEWLDSWGCENELSPPKA